MKKILVLICFILVSLNMLGVELMHNYYGDYKDVVRIVFVLRTQTHYSTMMDTDNKSLIINLSDTTINPGLAKLDFTGNQIVKSVDVATDGRGVRINIATNLVYYAEAEQLREETFKVFVDIYRYRDPRTLEQARNYVHFFTTVGYLDRARALQLRINRGEFSSEPVTYTPPPPPPPAPRPRLNFDNEDPFAYLRPDLDNLTYEQREWVIEAFRVYDLFKELRTIINNAERTLQEYEGLRTVDLTFVETMSISHNSLSDGLIKANEIRLQFTNLLGRMNFPSNEVIQYTEKMMNHVLSVLETYRTRIVNLQREYNSRINR